MWLKTFFLPSHCVGFNLICLLEVLVLFFVLKFHIVPSGTRTESETIETVEHLNKLWSPADSQDCGSGGGSRNFILKLTGQPSSCFLTAEKSAESLVATVIPAPPRQKEILKFSFYKNKTLDDFNTFISWCAFQNKSLSVDIKLV